MFWNVAFVTSAGSGLLGPVCEFGAIRRRSRGKSAGVLTVDLMTRQLLFTMCCFIAVGRKFIY